MKIQSRLFLAALALSTAIIAPHVALAQSKTLKVWTFLDPSKDSGREVALRQIIENFEAANPDINVNVEPQVWSQLTQQFVLAHNTNRAPDIVFLQSYDLSMVARSGAAASLTNLVETTWGEERQSDFIFSNLLDQMTFEGELSALPLFVYAPVLFYRSDLYEQAGITEADIATWDGFIAASQAVQQDGIAGVVVPLSPDRATQTPTMTALLDGQSYLLDENCEPHFANDAGIAAIDLTRRLYDEGIAMREDLSRHSDDAADVFSAGRAAAYFHTTTRYGAYADALEGNVAMAPWPGLTDGRPGPTTVLAWNLVVWEKSPNKADAISFVDYMVSQEAAELWSRIGEQPPLLHSVSAALEGEEFAPLRRMSEIIEDTGVMLPAQCRTGQVASNLNTAVQSVLVDRTDPSAALAEAERLTRENQ